jgi:S1-C subfamily serine protease
VLVLGVAAALLAGCGGGGGVTKTVQTTTTKVEVVKPTGSAADTVFDPAAIYRREAPGVVTILAVNDIETQDGGLGSGFILNGKGEIATNAHVVTTGERADIQKVREVYVDFADGNRVSAKILGFDPDADVALLKIDPSGLDLHPLPLGDSENVEVGEPVAAIGSPFDKRQSLTIGIVSAVDRDVSSLTKFQIAGAIQTDAAINPGNSGGPLVNARGEVLGLNQQIQTETGTSGGVGFAVPIDLAMHSIDQIREHGKVEYAYLGVSTLPVYPQLAEHFGLPVDQGAWVQEVTPATPADDAGLRAGGGEEQTFQAEGGIKGGGDIITKIDKYEITDPADLATAVARLLPGQEVSMDIYRGKTKRTVKVKLGKRPE